MFFKNRVQHVPKKANIIINIITISFLLIIFSVGFVLVCDNDKKSRDLQFDKAVGQFHVKLEQIETFVSIIGLNSFVKEISLLSEEYADPYLISQLVKNVNYFDAMLGQHIELFIIFKENGFSCDYEMYEPLILTAKKYNITDENMDVINNCISTHKAYNRLLLENNDNVIYLNDYTDCNILITFVLNNEFFKELFTDLSYYNGITVLSHGEQIWSNGNAVGENLSKKIRICNLTIKYYYSVNYQLVLLFWLFAALLGFLILFTTNIISNKLYEKIRFHIKRLALKANFDLPEDSVDLLTYVDMATENIGEMKQSLEKEMEQKYKNIRQTYLRLLITNDYIEKYSFAWDNVGLEPIGYYIVMVTEKPLTENQFIISIHDNIYLCVGENIKIDTKGKVGFSSTVRDLTNINKCFLEAVKAINYAFLTNTQNVKYSELNIIESDKLEKYLLEFKECVGVDCKKTKEIIEKIFDIFEKDVFNIKIISVIQELENYLGFSKVFTTLQNNVIYNITLDALKEIVVSSINNISVNYIIKKEKEKERLFSSIKNYIDDNIFNSNLSLNLIGVKMGYSVSQISKIVSDNIGLNFNDYINRRRIEKAKELLHEGCTVNMIVENCGFGSIATFRRLFKKYTGMTAQQFKILGLEK